MIHFGTTSAGQEVHKVSIANGDLSIDLLTWGAVVHDVRLTGIAHSLTLQSDDIKDYEGEMRHHGALIGPIANRISNARIRIDGMMHELERNQDGRVNLHSGAQATHLQVWDVDEVTEHSATLSLALPDGMCGLPGNRRVKVRFAITPPATLTMTVTATTDEKTAMNFANHCYWNLDGKVPWDGHLLQIKADHYLPCDDDTCPTGQIADVTGTPMDFRTPRAMVSGVPALDHNFCTAQARGPLRDVLTLTGQNGLSMTMATTEPGVQIYDGREVYDGLAIEAQCWPDAPNHAGFPDIMVTPDTPYEQITRWSFTTG